MSKGGGSTTTSPWSGAQPYLLQNYDFASQVLQNPPSYYPGQTYVGMLPQEQQAWQNQANFLGSAYGMPMRLNSSLPSYNTGTGSTGSTGSTSKGGTTGSSFYPSFNQTNNTLLGPNNTLLGPNITPSNWDFNEPSNNPGGAFSANDLNLPQYTTGQGLTQAQMMGPTVPSTGTGSTGSTSKGGTTPYSTAGSMTQAMTPTYGSNTKGGSTPVSSTPVSSSQPSSAPSYSQLVGTGSNLMSGGPSAGMTGMTGALAGQNLAGMFSGPQNLIGEPYNLYQGLSPPQTSSLYSGLQAPNWNWQAGNLMQGINPVGLDWGLGNLMQGVQGANINYQMPDLAQGVNPAQINYQMPDLAAGISTPQLNWQNQDLTQGISSPQLNWQNQDLWSGIGGAPQINYSPYQTPNLMQGLQGANINWQMPNLQQGINRTQMDPSQFTPSLSPEVQQSLSGMMSGTPDYSGIQAMVDAATTPMMRNFQNQLLPELASRTNMFNNNTGAIKELNRVIPELERNVGDIGAQLTWQERMRAGQEQQFATQLGAQTGLQAYGMGLQGAGQQAGLDQATQQLMANMGLSQAQLGAGLASQQAGLDQSFQQLMANQMGLQGQLGLQGWQTGAGLAGQQAGLESQNQQLMAQQLSQMAGMGLQGASTQAGLDAQTQALLANMGLSGAQLGLQGATTQAGLDQATQQLLAGQNLAGAQIGSGLAATQAGYGMDFANLMGQLNLGGANIGSGLAGQQAGLDWNLANLMAQQNQAGSQLGLQGATTQSGLLQNYMNTMAQQNALTNQLGLQGAQTGASLGMDWNQLLGGLNTTGANLGMDWNQLLAQQNQAQGQLGLQTDMAQQGAYDQYRGDVLGLGGLYNQLAGQTAQNMMSGAGMFPSMMQMGMLPGQFQQDYASQFLRPMAEQALMGDMSRYNYNQNLPMDMANWYSGIMSGAGGLGGTQQNQMGAGQTMQNMGNMAMMGYALYLMSDRNLKSDIRPAAPVLEALKKLPIYNWRYRGDPTPHIGPMAQDFRDAFGVGDGKTIHLVDVMGVLLGAMKELAQQKEATA